MYARWLRLLCADVTNRMRSGFSTTDVGTSPRRRPGLRRKTSSKFLGGSIAKGIDGRDACLETDWTDYGLLPVRLQTGRWMPILRGVAQSFHARVCWVTRADCAALRGCVRRYARDTCGLNTTVCSSVNDCITCEPPTRPIPLSVPARPPNGRCASQ